MVMFSPVMQAAAGTDPARPFPVHDLQDTI
jgi:hypothetical protein